MFARLFSPKICAKCFYKMQCKVHHWWTPCCNYSTTDWWMPCSDYLTTNCNKFAIAQKLLSLKVLPDFSPKICANCFHKMQCKVHSWSQGNRVRFMVNETGRLHYNCWCCWWRCSKVICGKNNCVVVVLSFNQSRCLARCCCYIINWFFICWW